MFFSRSGGNNLSSDWNKSVQINSFRRLCPKFVKVNESLLGPQTTSNCSRWNPFLCCLWPGCKRCSKRSLADSNYKHTFVAPRVTWIWRTGPVSCITRSNSSMFFTGALLTWVRTRDALNVRAYLNNLISDYAFSIEWPATSNAHDLQTATKESMHGLTNKSAANILPFA